MLFQKICFNFWNFSFFFGKETRKGNKLSGFGKRKRVNFLKEMKRGKKKNQECKKLKE